MSTSATQKQPIWIAHVDLDAFFASCEQRDNPEYRGKPVVVGALPGNRGVVAAASYEARVFGIRSAMPVSEAYRRCPDAIFLRPNMRKYADISRSVFDSLNRISPVIEKASIDEAYLEITGLTKLLGPPTHIGRLIKECIREASGLNASVGIGPNRLIAKLASDFGKPDGLTVVPLSEVEEFLSPMPVSVLRGAGKQTQKSFAALGISTIAELRALPVRQLAEYTGMRAAENFKRQAAGLGPTKISTHRRRKSISKERTFQKDSASGEWLRDELTDLARQVASTARRKKLAGKVIRLKVRYEGFDTYTRQVTLAASVNDERIIAARSWALFCNGDLPAKPVRLIGVGLSGLETADEQADLFADSGTRNERKILNLIDDVSSRFGDAKLRLGTRRNPK